MKKILVIFIISFISFATSVFAEDKVIGVVSAAIGEIYNQKNVKLKTGDKVYFKDSIIAKENSNTQVLLLDETTLTIGSKSEIFFDEFIYDPKNQSGKIISQIKNGSMKVITGNISEKNPANLEIKVPAGTIGTRGTEFQAVVDANAATSKILLIGPGANNSLGLRPGAVEVSNNLGNVLLDKPFLFTQMSATTAPLQPQPISEQELKNFQQTLQAKRQPTNADGTIAYSQQEIDSEIAKSNLLTGKTISGSTVLGDIAKSLFKSKDSGITMNQLAVALGKKDAADLGINSSEEGENLKQILNNEYGDGVALLLRYGGTIGSQSTFGELRNSGITGSYTYQASNVNMTNTRGTGSGVFSGTTVVDFNSRSITQSVSGTYNLAGGSTITFSNTSPVADYSNSSGSASISQNNFGITGTTNIASAETRFYNVTFNVINNNPVAAVATIQLAISDGTDTTTTNTNRIYGERSGITPKKQ
jgi:hypothetical protein